MRNFPTFYLSLFQVFFFLSISANPQLKCLHAYSWMCITNKAKQSRTGSTKSTNPLLLNSVHTLANSTISTDNKYQAVNCCVFETVGVKIKSISMSFFNIEKLSC